jgi:hypothetical protein
MNSLLKALTLLFSYCGKADDEDLFDIYYNQLKNYDEKLIAERITYLIATKKDTFLPAIGLILEVVTESNSAELEKAWSEFIRTRMTNHRFAPMPDWVYTIKIRLGTDRCEETLEGDSAIWLRKEFNTLYWIVKHGQVELLNDGFANKCIQLENKTVCVPVEGLDPERFPALITEINEHQLKIGKPNEVKLLGTENIGNYGKE